MEKEINLLKSQKDLSDSLDVVLSSPTYVAYLKNVMYNRLRRRLP